MVKAENCSKEEKKGKKNEDGKDKADVNNNKHNDNKQSIPSNASNEEIQKRDAKIKELEDLLLKQKELADSYYASLQRVSADLDNVQKRVTKEKAEIIEYANSKLILELIDIYENFERALQSGKKEGDLKKIFEGLEIIRKQFWQLLEREGLKPINAVGNPFDPFKEEAMLRVIKDDLPENTVVEEFQKGYMYKTRVLRTAKVAVSCGSKESKPEVNSETDKGMENGKGSETKENVKDVEKVTKKETE